MDGVRHDYVNNPKLDGFNFITQNGTKAESLVPVYQSSTFPSHVTMATGVTPDHHGIMHNSFYDKTKGSFSYSAEADWIEIPPIWAILEKQNIKTATYFWVGSETDWRGINITYSKAPFDGSIEEDQKLNQIITWLSLEPQHRPRLIMSWWKGTDSVAHQKGPSHPDVYRELAKQDKILKKLIDEISLLDLWHKVTLLIVSDHGMSDVSNFINVKEILKEHSIKAKVSTGPAVTHIFLEEGEDIDNVLDILKTNQNLSVWSKEELPISFNMKHANRTGDVIVTTSAPNMLVSRRSSNPPKGMHGYNPEVNHEMNGIFLAFGNGVKNKSIEKVDQVDLAPTILGLLGEEIPEYMNGKEIDLN